MKMAKSLWDGLLAIAVYNDSFYYVKKYTLIFSICFNSTRMFLTYLIVINSNQ